MRHSRAHRQCDHAGPIEFLQAARLHGDLLQSSLHRSIRYPEGWFGYLDCRLQVSVTLCPVPPRLSEIALARVFFYFVLLELIQSTELVATAILCVRAYFHSFSVLPYLGVFNI